MNETQQPPSKPPISRGDLWEALMLIEDPELGVDLGNLGLIRDVRVEGTAVVILMTLTSIGCPVADEIEFEVKNILGEVPGVKSVQVAFTFEPPWTPDSITEEGRDQLMALGYI